MANQITVTMRTKPCSCGCKGRDWAHAPTMVRALRGERLTSEIYDRGTYEIHVDRVGYINIADYQVEVQHETMVFKADGKRYDQGWHRRSRML